MANRYQIVTTVSPWPYLENADGTWETQDVPVGYLVNTILWDGVTEITLPPNTKTIEGRPVAVDPPVDLPALQATQAATINAAAQTALAEIVASYPALEVSTWDQQYAEAVAWTANNTLATPILSDISAAYGIPVSALAPAVIAKATAYKSASGAVIGKRLALTAAIYAATTPQEVVQVSW